jgi:hypothetical protein
VSGWRLRGLIQRDIEADGRPRLAVALGCAALLAYAAIKAAWGFGSTVGVVDSVRWENDVAGLGTLQLFVALWGTVLLDLGAAVVLVSLARPPSNGVRTLRRLVRWVAGIGAVVVGSAGIVGLATTLGPSMGLGHRGGDPLATWVFIVVYGSFTVVAASFAVVIGEDRSRERSGADAARRRP